MNSDLVIVEQASKLLLNYLLLISQKLGGPKIAMWGHGMNFQKNSASMLGEAIKRLISRHVHWWFAYTESSLELIKGLGFPEDRITVVQNAIDTRGLIDKVAKVRRSELNDWRTSLGLQGSNVGIFSGSLYTGKRLTFLFQAAHEVRKRTPDFELLVIGDGPCREVVIQAAERASWIHYLGPKFDNEKVPLFMLSRVMLLPGLVGLGIVDSFALEVPIVTIDSPFHGPEIDYLVNGVNGLKLHSGVTPMEYGRAVTFLLRNQAFYALLRKGCNLSASKYTLEEMVNRFCDGVLKATSFRIEHV